MNRHNRKGSRQQTNSDKGEGSPGRSMLQDNIKALRDLVRAITNETNRRKEEGENPNSDTGRQINEQKRSNRIAVTGHRISQKALFISKLALITSIAYFIVTGFIFYLTIGSVGAANGSVRISDSALAETRAEFNLLNDPFIQVDSITLSPAKDPRVLQFNYLISNLKNTVVKVYAIQTVFVFDTVPRFRIPQDTSALKDTLRAAIQRHYNKDFNKYLTKEAPLHDFIVPDEQHALTGATMQYYARKKVNIYQIGAVKYQNSITGKTRFYWYEIEINILHFKNGFIIYPNYMLNENEDE